MILNYSVGKTVDVYSYRQAGNIFSNISPVTLTDFLAVNTPTTLDAISICRSGTGFELARISGISFVKMRAYTLLYKGSSRCRWYDHGYRGNGFQRACKIPRAIK